MDKISRKFGEVYLKEWGDCIHQINIYQSELERLYYQKSIFNTYTKNINNTQTKSLYQVSQKQELKQDARQEQEVNSLKIYSDIILSKQLDLQKILSNYNFVNNIILNLDECKQAIIRLRYIKKLSWQSIAIQTHTSLRHCFNIKNAVIKNILDILPQ